MKKFALLAAIVLMAERIFSAQAERRRIVLCTAYRQMGCIGENGGAWAMRGYDFLENIDPNAQALYMKLRGLFPICAEFL